MSPSLNKINPHLGGFKAHSHRNPSAKRPRTLKETLVNFFSIILDVWNITVKLIFLHSFLVTIYLEK